MGLGKLLNDEQRAEVASIVMTLRNGYTRIAEILEEATAGEENEQTRGLVETVRQVATAVDFQLLFPSPTTDRERIQELARGMVGEVFQGAPPPTAQASGRVSAEPPQAADDEWQD